MYSILSWDVHSSRVDEMVDAQFTAWMTPEVRIAELSNHAQLHFFVGGL